MKKVFYFFIFNTVLLISSCAKESPFVDNSIGTESMPDAPVIPEDQGNISDDLFNGNSQQVSYSNAVTIHFTEDGMLNVDNPFENAGVEVLNNGQHVIINSTITDKELNYILQGATSNGSIKIYGEKKFALILNGVYIKNTSGAAINIQNKKKCELVLVDNTNNRLIDSSEYTYIDGEDMKGTLFTEGNIEIANTTGSLELRGLNKHAFCSDGALTINGGSLIIKEAVSDGIHTNDEITINGGVIDIRCQGDGIESESKKLPVIFNSGNIKIVTLGEKGHAVKTKFDVNVLGNESNLSLDIITYGNASKGIKPTGNFYMSGGKIFISCAGDAIWEVDESDISSSAGIKCDGDFLIEGGDIEILSTGKGGKGINVDGTLVIDNGNITVNTTGDQYVYDKNNDTAAKAIKSDGNLDVNGGNIVIRTYKKEAEGLESKSVLTISGGDIDIMAYDDCINASNHIQINGGTIFCYSETNDGIDSNGTLSISGGTIVSVGAGAPEDGFDCDNNRFSITGGLVLGIGGNSSTPTSSYCTQRSLLFNSTTQLSIINIQDASTNDNILTFKLPRSYSKLTMLFSSPGLLGSTNYNIYSGGTITGGSSFHGLYLNSNYAQGSLINSFTTGSADGSVTNLGGSNNNRPF